MRATFWIFALLSASGAFAGCAGDDLGKSPFAREFYEWNDFWVENADVQKGDLPRVLLIGDSISRRYRDGVSQRLAGKAMIVNSAGSRCVGDPVLMAETRHALSLYEYDVIHFNNGLHGFAMKDDADFPGYLREWIAEIRRLQPKAKLVWATITRPLDGTEGRVDVRNALALEVVKELGGIAVDDLYSITTADPSLISGDKVHPTPEGAEKLADAVAASILEELGKEGSRK